MTTSRLYPDRPFLAASVAVVRDGKVLLAARARPPLAHVFSLPGGLVEPGETLAEAALRELDEEVSVTAEIVAVLSPVEVIHKEPDGRTRSHFVVVPHAARWISGEPQVGVEALEIRWVGPGEIAGLEITPGLEDVVERALAMAG